MACTAKKKGAKARDLAINQSLPNTLCSIITLRDCKTRNFVAAGVRPAAELKEAPVVETNQIESRLCTGMAEPGMFVITGIESKLTVTKTAWLPEHIIMPLMAQRPTTLQ